MGIWDLSKTAASNTSIEGVSWAEGMNAANVNNGVRAIAAALKEFQEDTGGALSTSGSSNSYVLATNGTVPALADGVCLAFIANHANTGAATLNVDSLGAKAIRKGGDVALVSGDIPSGMACLVSYDASANSAAGAWLLHNPYVSAAGYYAVGGTDVPITDGGTGASTAADARTNLGLAALAVKATINNDDWSGADLAVANGGTGASSASAARTALGVAIGSDVQAYHARLEDIAGITYAQGDVFYYNGSNVVKLAKGTASQVLSMNAGATAPEWAAASSGLSAASQAEQETGTSTSVAVTPGRQHFHPGHPKAWGLVTVSAGTPTLAASYNVTSVTDTATGRLTVNWATDFASTSYSVRQSVEVAYDVTDSASPDFTNYTSNISTGTRAAGSIELHCLSWGITDSSLGDQDIVLADPAAWHFDASGDFA